jgi:hypothetical protein
MYMRSLLTVALLAVSFTTWAAAYLFPISAWLKRVIAGPLRKKRNDTSPFPYLPTRKVFLSLM